MDTHQSTAHILSDQYFLQSNKMLQDKKEEVVQVAWGNPIADLATEKLNIFKEAQTFEQEIGPEGKDTIHVFVANKKDQPISPQYHLTV